MKLTKYIQSKKEIILPKTNINNVQKPEKIQNMIIPITECFVTSTGQTNETFKLQSSFTGNTIK